MTRLGIKPKLPNTCSSILLSQSNKWAQGIFFRVDKKVLKLDVVMDARPYKFPTSHCTLKQSEFYSI